MEQKLFDARDDLFAEYKPGKASKYIRPFDRLKATDKVLLVERVSGRERKENLKDQDRNLKGATRKVGAEVVGRFPIQCSGFDPSWLRDAANKAHKLSATVLLAETTDRFVRNEAFRAGKKGLQDYQATNAQLAKLKESADGIPLMTHLHPDATPSEVRSYQRKRGQQFKSRKGGRPTAGATKGRREKKLGLVLLLHKEGKSLNEIAKKRMVGVPRSTVHEWIKKYSK